MTQSLTQLPKTVDFNINGQWIEISNYEVVQPRSLFHAIMHIIHYFDSDKNTLTQFEKHGISFEMVIECCARELDKDNMEFTIITHDCYKILTTREKYIDWDTRLAFSKSVVGKKIVQQITERIRDCNNWEDLYDEMQLTSKFQKEIKRRIRMGLSDMIKERTKRWLKA